MFQPLGLFHPEPKLPPIIPAPSPRKFFYFIHSLVWLIWVFKNVDSNIGLGIGLRLGLVLVLITVKIGLKIKIYKGIL